MEKGQITNEWSMDQFRHIDHRDYGLRQLNLKKLVVNHSEYYSNNHEMIELKNFNFKYGKTRRNRAGRNNRRGIVKCNVPCRVGEWT